MNSISSKVIFVLLTLSIVFLFSFCSDENGPSKSKYRYIYYPVSLSDTSNESMSGLYRVSTDVLEFFREVSNSVIYTTGVGESGVIVFEYDNNINKLWAKCVNGDIVQVPMPEPLDGFQSADLLLTPKIVLSADGHNVAYFVNNTPNDSAGPENIFPELILYGCTNDVMTRISLTEFIQTVFEDMEVTTAEPYGENILINKNATKVWFVLKGVKYLGGNVITEKYAVCKWTQSGGLELVGDILDDWVKLWALINITEKLIIIRMEDYARLETLEPSGELAYNNLTFTSLSNPNQMVIDRSEMVVWAEEGIELVHPDAGNLLQRIISYDELDPDELYNHTPNQRLSISTDGKWIVVALQNKQNGHLYTLFMVDREGENLKEIANNIPMGAPVISSEMER